MKLVWRRGGHLLYHTPDPTFTGIHSNISRQGEPNFESTCTTVNYEKCPPPPPPNHSANTSAKVAYQLQKGFGFHWLLVLATYTTGVPSYRRFPRQRVPDIPTLPLQSQRIYSRQAVPLGSQLLHHMERLLSVGQPHDLASYLVGNFIFLVHPHSPFRNTERSGILSLKSIYEGCCLLALS